MNDTKIYQKMKKKPVEYTKKYFNLRKKSLIRHPQIILCERNFDENSCIYFLIKGEIALLII